jgi:PAS domain S-box-containing protein
VAQLSTSKGWIPLSPRSGAPFFQTALWRALLFGAAYFGCSLLGQYLQFPESSYWPIWPPSGLFLGVLVISDRRDWPLLWAVSLPASLLADALTSGFQMQLLGDALGIWLANTLESLGGAWLLARIFTKRITLDSVREFLLLSIVGGVVAPMIGATLGALTAAYFDQTSSLTEIWLRWWIGDAVGVMVVAPVVITWSHSGGSPRIFRRPWAYYIEFTLYCLVLVYVTEHVFHGVPEENSLPTRFPFFLTMPLMLWAGLRFEPRGASVCVLLLGLIITWRTTQGFGPIARYGEGVTQQGLLLQALLAQGSCLTLLLSSSIERRALVEMRLKNESSVLTSTEAEMRRQKDLLQSILDSMGEAVIVVDVAGRLVQFNPAARKTHGLEAEPFDIDDLERDAQSFLADGITPCPRERIPVIRALAGEDCDGVPLVIRRGDGTAPTFARVTARPIRSANGAIAGAVAIRTDITALIQSEHEQAKLIDQLQHALSEIKTLRGLIPICARCKKIRNDTGAWERLESYVSAHTEAEFTHGVCPDCCPVVFGENWKTSMEDTISDETVS